MKGIIIVNGYSKTEGIKYQTRRLTEEFNKQNVKIEVKRTSDLLAYLDNGSVKTELKADFIVYLDKDIHIAMMLEKCGFRLFNSRESIENCDDKMRTHILLSNHDISMPLTISSPLMYQQNEDNFLDNVLNLLDYPIVVKNTHGSLGGQVYLANDFSTLCKLRNQLKLEPHIYQQFIQSSCGKDTRVIVIGGEVVAGYNRISTKDFRSNIELGGSGKSVELPASYTSIATKVASILQLDYCGIDILDNNGEPMICEVNSNAFFTGAEKYTGVNIAKAYVDYIVKTLEKK